MEKILERLVAEGICYYDALTYVKELGQIGVYVGHVYYGAQKHDEDQDAQITYEVCNALRGIEGWMLVNANRSEHGGLHIRSVCGKIVKKFNSP